MVDCFRLYEPYIDQSNGSINADVYLNQCVKSKFKKHHGNDDDMIFCPDLARARSADILRRSISTKNY